MKDYKPYALAAHRNFHLYFYRDFYRETIYKSNTHIPENLFDCFDAYLLFLKAPPGNTLALNSITDKVGERLALLAGPHSHAILATYEARSGAPLATFDPRKPVRQPQ